jgi:hypothetical protein
MFPRNVTCEDCGKLAFVRGYGRIEYDWPENTTPGHETSIPTINCVRLTIDCPHCGVKVQEFYPDETSASRHNRLLNAARRILFRRNLEVRFQRLSPINPAHI